jgi:hypothetical protein
LWFESTNPVWIMAQQLQTTTYFIQCNQYLHKSATYAKKRGKQQLKRGAIITTVNKELKSTV